MPNQLIERVVVGIDGSAAAAAALRRASYVAALPGPSVRPVPAQHHPRRPRCARRRIHGS
jgi:hypothetical protein